MAAAGAAFGVSGCLDGGGDGETRQPIALDGGQSCDVCGMVIPDQPGPVGEIYYSEGGPEERGDDPAWFCSTVCTFDYLHQGEGRGWSTEARYVTDYSDVDYEVYEEGGSSYLSAHLEAESFTAAGDTVLVADSSVLGSMGSSLIPFGDREDAEEFQGEHGGDLVAFDDVTRELVASL